MEKHLEVKAVLKHVWGLWGGHVCVVWQFWRHLGPSLDDFRVIWGARSGLTSVLRHLVGPVVPKRLP